MSALRTPIADLERKFDEGKDVDVLELHAIQNATDVFNEVSAGYQFACKAAFPPEACEDVLCCEIVWVFPPKLCEESVVDV